ncbi:hypothetical protein, partial [Paracidovorax valerianellae]
YWNNHTLQILRPSISRTTCQIKGLQIVQGGLGTPLALINLQGTIDWLWPYSTGQNSRTTYQCCTNISDAGCSRKWRLEFWCTRWFVS